LAEGELEEGLLKALPIHLLLFLFLLLLLLLLSLDRVVRGKGPQLASHTLAILETLRSQLGALATYNSVK
jgi:hypothetical protein